MCGIAGIYNYKDSLLLRRMMESLTHRGSDENGFFVTDSLCLGHQRLSIIDLYSGKQPIFNETRNMCIILNGEIYNYKTLRESLSDRHKFNTQSDTEVVLHLYEEYGIECVEKLEGMFALAIYDEGKLLLARDRIGIKPLYYAFENGELFFASEIKSLINLNLNEIKEFPPAHIFRTDIGFRQYYFLGKRKNNLNSTDSIINQIQSLLYVCVKKRLVADVPVGVFLSGGLDSSIICALMKKELKGVHSFSVGTEDSKDLLASREVAKYFNTFHHEYIITKDEVSKEIENIIFYLESFDAPLVRSSVANYFVAKLAKPFVKVILTGEGADELFAGYQYMKSIDFNLLSDEIEKLIKSLHNTNLQRTDRMTMAHSLEARVPFLDHSFIDLAFSIPIEFIKSDSEKMEKWILRKAFEDFLPSEVVWRKKEKFSEGSGVIPILVSLANESISDGEFENANTKDFNLKTKEEFYYFKIFSKFYDPYTLNKLIGRTSNY